MFLLFSQVSIEILSITLVLPTRSFNFQAQLLMTSHITSRKEYLTYTLNNI